VALPRTQSNGNSTGLAQWEVTAATAEEPLGSLAPPQVPSTPAAPGQAHLLGAPDVGLLDTQGMGLYTSSDLTLLNFIPLALAAQLAVQGTLARGLRQSSPRLLSERSLSPLSGDLTPVIANGVPLVNGARLAHQPAASNGAAPSLLRSASQGHAATTPATLGAVLGGAGRAAGAAGLGGAGIPAGAPGSAGATVQRLGAGGPDNGRFSFKGVRQRTWGKWVSASCLESGWIQPPGASCGGLASERS